MSTLRPSIEKQITDRLLLRVQGKDDQPLPDGLDDFSSDKDRRVAAMPGKTARLSLYALKQNEPQRDGDQRRPMRLTRTLLVELRVLLQGDDDALDGFRQWVTQCFATADRLKNADDATGLALSVRESESITDLAQDSTGSVLMWLSRWSVEYTTLPADLSVTGRNLS